MLNKASILSDVLSGNKLGDILSDNEIVKNVLSGDLLSDNKVGNILSGVVGVDIIDDVLSNNPITGIAGGVAERRDPGYRQ